MSVPKHLRERGRVLFEQVSGEFELEPHALELLRLASEALDRTEQARQALADEGILTVTSQGRRVAHPAVSIERDGRLAVARLLREIGLDEPLPDSRPPRRRH